MKFIETMKPRSNSRLLIVDALNFSFRWKHKKQFNFAEDYLRTVQSLAKSYSTGQVLITADKGSSSYRRTIYPEYKANRAEKYANQTEQERLDAEAFFNGYEETLQLLTQEYPVLRFDRVEADDIAACLVKHNTKFEHIWLISSDKDWNLLVGPNVSQFSYITRKETTNDNWFEHHQVSPEFYLGLKCLQGDTGDNIKGISGVGPKRGYELLEKYDGINGIMDNLPLKGSAKYIQALNTEGPTIIPRNLQLMDLISFCDEAIGYENVKEVIKNVSSSS